MIQQAIHEWQNIIIDNGTMPNPYPITFAFTDFGPSSNLLANTSTYYFEASGNLDRADMTFNTRYTFFVDPSPADDSEFDGTTPPPGTDLLTVARHELGHAVGFFSNPARVLNRVSNGAFAAPRLNIAFTEFGGGHVDPAWLPNDLMVPSLGESTRQSISLYPSASLIALAYGYTVPLQFVDPTYAGISTGTASQPWQSLAIGNAIAPAGIPLLLSNAAHHVPANQQLRTARIVNAARGGSIVVSP